MLRSYIRKAYRTLLPLIYAKTNYKMFLKCTFDEIDDTLSELACTTDVFSKFLKPVSIKAPFGNTMMVIAPHHDDEIIGCGGAMLLQLANKQKVHIVFAQDGGDEYIEDGFKSRSEMVEIREKEACRVADGMGLDRPIFLRHERFDEKTMSVVASDLKKQIENEKPDSIFLPFFLDHNRDHRMVNYCLAEALSGMDVEPMIYGYEVWGLCAPNVILNIDSVMEMKRKLLSYYVSQVSGTDYVHCISGLNMYHSKAFGAGVCKYAERFFEIPSSEYKQVIKKIRK